MARSKFLACTVCAITVLAAGCADGTGKALTPTLPSTTSTTNADGTLLKATAPRLASPTSSIRVASLTPTLRLSNAAGTFDSSAALSYVFQVFEGTTLIVESGPVAAASPETTWNVPANVLKLNTTYAWRARATYAGIAGSWTDPGAQFRTPVPVVVVVPDGPGPVSCGGSSGPSIIACVGAAYPSKLVAKVSVETRKAHMAFIRDRIIETGRCKGNDFGRNFKRGTPVLSIDYLVWRQPGQKDRGVDLASGYDDPRTSLRLTWQVKGPPDYGFPYYAAYGPVDCSGVNQ